MRRTGGALVALSAALSVAAIVPFLDQSGKGTYGKSRFVHLEEAIVYYPSSAGPVVGDAPVRTHTAGSLNVPATTGAASVAVQSGLDSWEQLRPHLRLRHLESSGNRDDCSCVAHGRDGIRAEVDSNGEALVRGLSPGLWGAVAISGPTWTSGGEVKFRVSGGEVTGVSCSVESWAPGTYASGTLFLQGYTRPGSTLFVWPESAPGELYQLTTDFEFFVPNIPASGSHPFLYGEVRATDLFAHGRIYLAAGETGLTAIGSVRSQ